MKQALGFLLLFGLSQKEVVVGAAGRQLRGYEQMRMKLQIGIGRIDEKVTIKRYRQKLPD